jgi:two-component system, OmpR family, alkaline phosphatase synthesis response regulator PhoP
VRLEVTGLPENLAAERASEMKTILIVEDEFAIADMLAATLEDEGYKTVLAGNGREALACLAQGRPDLIISDIMMPIMDGRKMLHVMQTEYNIKGVPIILMSAADEAIGIADNRTIFYVNKPFDLIQLIDLVSRLIGSSD